jgi:hypothetical protein
VKNLAAVGKPVTAAAFSHVHLRQYATYAYGYYPAGYGSAAEPDLDGDSDDLAPQTARPAIQGLMTGPAAVWRAMSAASAGPVVLVLIIALILFGYSLYANMTNLDPGPVAAKRADLTGADRPRTVAALRASRDVPPVVSVPGRALARDLEPSSGRPPANAASDRPSPLIVAPEGRRELTPTASPEPEAGALDRADLDHSEGRSPSPADEAVEPRSAPWVGPDPERLALAQSSAPQIGDLEAPRPGKPAARGSPVGSPPSGVAAPQPSPARPAGALPGSEAAYRIQLASYHRQADAERAWQVFSAVLGEELSGLWPNVESADTSRGVFYRLQAGPLATAAAAAAICGRVRQRGADCLVVRSNGV